MNLTCDSVVIAMMSDPLYTDTRKILRGFLWHKNVIEERGIFITLLSAPIAFYERRHISVIYEIFVSF